MPQQSTNDLDLAFLADCKKHASVEQSLRNRHWLVLSISIVVLGLALSLRVVDGARIAFKGFEDYPLPHVCMSRLLLNANCPACGLTRATVHTLHGRWAESRAVHPSGAIVAVFILLQIPYRAMGLLLKTPRPLGKSAPIAITIAIGVVSVALWCESYFFS